MKNFLFLLLCLGLFLPAGQAARYYVNAAAGNDANTGVSWAQAFKTFQKAIEVANNNDEIWLTSGTYRPTKDFSGQSYPNTIKRFLGFYISKSLQVYGRFAGTETNAAQRNQNTAPPILSGDIDGDDLNNPAQAQSDIQGENGLTVLHMTNLPTNGIIRLDDLIITAGQDGGGLLLADGGTNETIVNCRFTGNFGSNDHYSAIGGAQFYGSTTGSCFPKLTNCTFDHNGNLSGAGGCFVWAGNGPCNANFTNCTFSENAGGGLGIFAANGTSNVNVQNSSFSTNTNPMGYGGGISCGNANLSCTNCNFQANQALQGGAIGGYQILGNNRILLTNCSLLGNIASQSGGGLYLQNANASLLGTTFDQNFAQNGSGGGVFIEPYLAPAVTSFYTDQTQFFLNHCEGNGGAICSRDPLANIQIERPNFRENQATKGGAISIEYADNSNANTTVDRAIFNTNLCPYGSGGAIYLKQAPGTTHSGGLKVTNATFYGNFCNVVGSVVFTDNAQFNGSNLISWGSTTVPDRGEFSSINGGTSDVTYSLLQSVNCATAGITGCSTDIFNKDPLFIDVNNYNFHLPMCSPAVNTGSVTNSMLTDYDGNPRPYNDGTGATDMGAYEFQGTPPNNFYQDKDGDGYGITTYKIKACTAPPGFAALPGDCNDFDAEINPGHAEICDGKDNNCNNLVDYLDPTYIDNTPPSFTTPAPANLVLTCTDQIPAPAILLATDNCTPNPSVTLTTNSTRSNDPNNCAYYSYSITRTWTAKDLKNNTASVSQVITVKDDQPPVFNQISPNVTISCDQAIPGYIPPSATDNCSGVTVTMETVTTRSADPNDCAYYTYTITRTWTAKDRCNNATTAQQIITVQDTKAPYVLFPPAPQVYVECDEAIPQITSLTSQDCDAHPIFKLTEETETFEANPSDHIFQRITRHISLTDHCGNHVDYQQIVNIRDRKPPVITNCPKDITVQGTEDGAAVNFPAAIVTESCGYELYYTPNEPGGTFPIGTTEESIDAYDKGGNYTSCTFKVTVLDDFKVHCQDDIFVDVPFGSNPDRNTVNWNPPFAKACSFCDSQEAQTDFQQDFRPLGNLNGHRYYISKQKNTPAESALACAERQGYLVSIGDKTENRFLTNELAGQSILIGLSDKIQESNFIWADGQNTGFSNWAANNPVTGANAQSRDFVRLGADGRWLNVGNDTAFFVCEVNCYDIKKMAGNIPANHALPTGNFKETYTLTDMCGRTDTCGQNVYVYRNEQSYCTPNIYPSALDQDTTLWIKSFKMGNLSQETGNNKGYYRHPNLAETFETGKSYTLDVVTASNQNGPTNSYVRVWIDLNADRDFYDAGELLIDTFLPSGVLHTTLQIPSNTRLGNLRQRLRVATSRFAAPEACGDYIIGETEDYRVAFRTPDFSNDQTAARSNKSESGALLYPNPASNVAWVSLQGDSDAACTIQLMSVNGAILRTLNVPAGETNPQRLDLSGLAAGVYFVQIHQDGQAVQMEKLVVEKE